MRKLVLTSMGLLLALPCLFAEEPRTEDFYTPPTYNWVNRRVNTLLPSQGGKVQLDQDQTGSLRALHRGMNKVYYHSNPKDNSLVKIEIEAIGEESPGMAVLAATFLTALSAVESIEEGTSLANLLTAENAKDGRPRSIQLANGMKFMKIKTETTVPKFVIVL